MRASIIIVTHNHPAYFRGCVRRVVAHTSEYELIVVDNGSSPEAAQLVKEVEERGTASHVVVNGENLGYAAGCNQGIRLASCPWVVLLHTDCFVTPRWLDRLLGHVERHADDFRIGAVVPVTNYANENFPVYDEVLRQAFVEFKLPNKSNPTDDDIDGVLRRTYPESLDAYASSVRCRTPLVYSNEISSFCTAFSTRVFDECGFFDEGYSMRGYEDRDMYMRMQDCGFETWSARNCFVHHFGNITSDGAGFCFPELMDANRERFERVWACR